jgi:hypothetical protein
LQVLKEHQVSKVATVKMDVMARMEKMVNADPQEYRAVDRAELVPPVLQVQLVLLVLLVPQDLQVQRVLPAPLVLPDQLERKVLRECPEQRVQTVQQVHKVFKVRQVREVCKEFKVSPELQVQQAHKVRLVRRA